MPTMTAITKTKMFYLIWVSYYIWVSSLLKGCIINKLYTENTLYTIINSINHTITNSNERNFVFLFTHSQMEYHIVDVSTT